MSKIDKNDFEITKKLLERNSPVNGTKTWLRHKADGESGLIDLMILEGTFSINEMIDKLSQHPHLKAKSPKQWEKRIRDHISHLSTVSGDSRNKVSGQGGHNLPVIEKNDGRIAFDFNS